MKKLKRGQGKISVNIVISLMWILFFVEIIFTVMAGKFSIDNKWTNFTQIQTWSVVGAAIVAESVLAAFFFAIVSSLKNVYSLVDNQYALNKNLLESLALLQDNINLNHDATTEILSELKPKPRTTTRKTTSKTNAK
ncbi:MAG: hypothetical protein LBM27_01390 [Lactobacillaceae bacterium]|jgi:hypothetical protein|nr:hypothetical protein [Lactobacillaceae bacterium]